MKPVIKYQYILLNVIIFSVLLSSCNMEKRKELEAKAEQLEHQLYARDSAFNDIMDLMTKVESQIELIKERENIIASRSGDDFASSTRQGLVEDIDIINELIKTTTSQVQNLSSKLNKANIQIGSFKSRINNLSQELDLRKGAIAELQEQLELKDNKINQLDGEVKHLITQVNDLGATIVSQNEKISENNNVLNTAYYVVNSEKNLQENGFVTKEGGFLGLGKTIELQESISPEKFEKIDIRKTSRFYINSNKMNLVTEHPKDSYEVVKDEKEIVKYIDVTNPGEFWRISKYLVISVKG